MQISALKVALDCSLSFQENLRAKVPSRLPLMGSFCAGSVRQVEILS